METKGEGVKIVKLTWKDVLNPNHEWHGSRNYFFNNVVKPSGYPYFMWNDRIYKVVQTENGWKDYIETAYTNEIIS